MHNNEQIIENIISDVNSMYEIYMNSAKDIEGIDVYKMFFDIKNLINDIKLVKTDFAREAIINKLNCLIDDSCNKAVIIKSIIDSTNKNINQLRSKMPLPKEEVKKLLKMFNFHDYAEDETTDGNFSSYKENERHIDFLEDKVNSIKSNDVHKNNLNLEEDKKITKKNKKNQHLSKKSK